MTELLYSEKPVHHIVICHQVYTLLNHMICDCKSLYNDKLHFDVALKCYLSNECLDLDIDLSEKDVEKLKKIGYKFKEIEKNGKKYYKSC